MCVYFQCVTTVDKQMEVSQKILNAPVIERTQVPLAPGADAVPFAAGGWNQKVCLKVCVSFCRPRKNQNKVKCGFPFLVPL